MNLSAWRCSRPPTTRRARWLRTSTSGKLRGSLKYAWTHARIRRALLHQSTPSRGPFPVGAYVYFYRQQVRPGQTGDRSQRWHGPARVIGIEPRNPHRLEDPEEMTDGAAPHSYWLRYGSSVVLTSGEQMRFANEDLAAHMVPQEIQTEESIRGARNYVDVRPRLPQEPQPPSAGQSTGYDHWQTNSDGTVARVHLRPRLALFTPQNTGCPIPVTGLRDYRLTLDGDGDQGEIHDDWRGRQANRSLGVKWTGQTTFWPDLQPSSSSQPLSTTSQPASAAAPSVLQPLAPSVPPPLATSTSQSPPALPATDPLPAIGPPANQQPPVPRALPPGVDGQHPMAQYEPEPAPTTSVPPTPPGELLHAIRDPDRLDGVPGAVRTQRHRPPVPGPYVVEDEDGHYPDECGTLTTRIRRRRLRMLAGDSGSDGSSTAEEDNQDQNIPTNFMMEEAMLTGKAVRSETNLKDLDPEDRALYDVSMGDEWQSWIKFEAVDILTEKQKEDLDPDIKVVGTRWVHTDKNRKARLLALRAARKTGKSRSQIKKEFPSRPRADWSCKDARRSISASAVTAPRHHSSPSTWSAPWQ